MGRELEGRSTGERIRILRRGLSRPVLAGLVGRGPEWLEKIGEPLRNVMSTARIVAAILLLGSALSATGCTNDRGSTHATPGLRIEASKARYRQGEPVVLSLTVTNRTDRSCRLSRVPAGAVVFRSVIRDGQPVLPTLARATYIAGFQDLLASALMEVGPGQSLSMRLTSEANPSVQGRPALETSTLDSGNEESLLVWPLDQPGDYRVTAAYVFPAFASRPADVCRGQTDWVSTGFRVAAG